MRLHLLRFALRYVWTALIRFPTLALSSNSPNRWLFGTQVIHEDIHVELLELLELYCELLLARFGLLEQK